jgi:hypothetical protein
LSFKLKRSVEVLVGAALTMALVALMLAIFPAVAEAQTETQDTSSIVVRPGDCLWSITSERLGPNASPQQIAIGVKRIYALNRDLIGADPNLIFPGQVLSFPAMDEASRGKLPTRVTSKREGEGTESVAPSSRVPRGKGEQQRASTKRASEVGSGSRKAPGSVVKTLVTKPVTLPKMPTNQVTPKIDLLSATEASSPIESFGRNALSLLSWATSAVVGLFPQNENLLGRRLLGLGIIGLTLLIAAFMVWKLPMRRPLFNYEMWPGIYASAYNNPPPQEDMHRSGGTPEPVPLTSEWEPDDELKYSLLGMPLQVWTLPQEDLTKLIYHVEGALAELAWLDQRRELLDTERQLEAALKNLLRELSAMVEANG